MKKHDYAIGNKEGPVLVDGTVYKSQQEYNGLFSFSLIIVGIFLYIIGLTFLGLLLGFIGVVFFIAVSQGGKKGKKQKNKNDSNYIGWIVFIIVLIGIFWFFSNNSSTGVPSRNTSYIVEVTGTQGLDFSGSLGGGGSTTTVDGRVPSTYTIRGWPAVAVMQKSDEYGTLTVTIKKDDKILDRQTTTAQYGVVTVSSG